MRLEILYRLSKHDVALDMDPGNHRLFYIHRVVLRLEHSTITVSAKMVLLAIDN